VVFIGHGKKQPFHVKERITTHTAKVDDYLIIRFTRRPRSEARLAHRIIAHHFVPNPENKPQVNHKNGNKEDNRACNLEWSTEKENTEHAFKTGLKDNKKPKRSRLAETLVLEIFNCPLSLSKAALFYNIPKLTIQAIRTGKRYGRITQKPFHGENGRNKIYG